MDDLTKQRIINLVADEYYFTKQQAREHVNNWLKEYGEEYLRVQIESIEIRKQKYNTK